MSCADAMRDFVKSKVDVAKSLLSIPSRKESMAGVIILYVFTNSIATSIWMFNAWTPYVYLTFNRSNWHVGVMSATNGVFELVTAFISGYLADRVLGPSRTLRYAVMFGILTMSIVLMGIWTDQVWMLVVAQMCEGTYMGFSFTCLESVFAQCMRKGERDRLYSVKFAFEAAGPIVGLLLTISLFLVVGDEWKKSILRNVMTAGLLLHLTSLITFLCTFVPVPCHLDRVKATDVAVVADRATGEVYELEDPRISVDESDEHDLPPLHLSRTTEMINQARTAVLQARSFFPRTGMAYEPSVCTATQEGRQNDNGSDDDDNGGGNCSQAVNSQSFFSANGTKASMRLTGGTEALSEANASDGNHRTRRERSNFGDNDEDGGDGPGKPYSTNQPAAHALGDDEEDRRVVGYLDTEYTSASPWRQKMMDCIPLKRYPVLVVLADMILIIGSGMTTQYFSLFMMEIYGIRPVVLNALNLCNSFIISFMAIVNGVMGKRYGRVRALLPPKYIGSFILLYMALSREHRGADGTYPFVHPFKRVVMCVCYVVRNAFMNCSAGLSRALIMDLVSERNRGRWNALESVQSAGWSGTALIGGIVADNFGYGTSFLVTFAFHVFSCVMLTPLAVRNDSKLPIPLYEDGVEGGAADRDKASHSGKGDENESGSSATQRCTLNLASSDGKVISTSSPASVKVVELTVANVQRMASSAMLQADQPLPQRHGGEGEAASEQKSSRSQTQAAAT